MKTLSGILAIILFCIFLSTGVYGENKIGGKKTTIAESDFYKIKDDIQEIRRDQLNYKIEKDLLKETYSTNYQTINFMISLALLFLVLWLISASEVSQRIKNNIWVNSINCVN
ncbi:MAG: hypothetical protein AABZ15_13530 [Nitrospirota bacterium]